MAPRKTSMRRARSPYENRYMRERARAAAVGRRVREEAMKRDEMLISLGASAALGYAKRKGVALPTIGGIEPTLLYGLILGIGLPMVSKDKMAKRLEAAGTGLLTVSAYSIARTGTMTVSGTMLPTDELIGGDVEIVGDDDEYDEM